jgi:hypothetical protein
MGFFDSFGHDYVASMENAIDAAEVRTGGRYEQLPDGKYQMFVKSLAIKESNQLGGYPNFLLQLTVLDGEYAGRSAYKRYTLEPEAKSMGFLKSDLYLLGVNLTSLYDLENAELMTKVLDQIVEVTIKNKMASNGKNYPNYYLNRVVGNMASGSADDDPFAPVDPNNTPWGR